MRRQRSLAAFRRALQDPEEPACSQESSPPFHNPFLWTAPTAKSSSTGCTHHANKYTPCSAWSSWLF